MTCCFCGKPPGKRPGAHLARCQRRSTQTRMPLPVPPRQKEEPRLLDEARGKLAEVGAGYLCPLVTTGADLGWARKAVNLHQVEHQEDLADTVVDQMQEQEDLAEVAEHVLLVGGNGGMAAHYHQIAAQHGYSLRFVERSKDALARVSRANSRVRAVLICTSLVSHELLQHGREVARRAGVSCKYLSGWSVSCVKAALASLREEVANG